MENCWKFKKLYANQALNWLHTGAGTDVSNLKAAHNTTVVFTCIDHTDAHFPPAWWMDGSLVLTKDGYASSRDKDTGELIGILTINGNQSCGAFNVYCRPYSGQIMHNTTLTIEG